MSGQLTARWGRLTNLTVLNLGAPRAGEGGRAPPRQRQAGVPPPADLAGTPAAPAPPCLTPPTSHAPRLAPRSQRVAQRHAAARAGQPPQVAGAQAGHQLPAGAHRWVRARRQRGGLCSGAPASWGGAAEGGTRQGEQAPSLWASGRRCAAEFHCPAPDPAPQTPGDWIGDLTDLEVLTLGANGGVNEGEGAGPSSSGLMGTLPEGLSSLTKLVELDLQARVQRGRGRRRMQRARVWAAHHPTTWRAQAPATPDPVPCLPRLPPR
jgi:hypothetical protein